MYTEALEKWLNLTNEQQSPLDGSTSKPPKTRFLEWMTNVRIGLRLGANICVAHTCHCGKRVEQDDLHGFSCTKSAGRYSRHATLNFLIKQTLGSLDLPLMLEPRGLYRTDGKRPDGVTMIPWEMGKQVLWDVTIVDALAPSRLNKGSLCRPGTTATEAEARKIEKYCELINNGYIFQQMALEVQGSFVKSNEIFITRLCKMLCRSHDDQRDDSFLRQQFFTSTLDRQCSLCSRYCERQRCVRRKLLKIVFFKKNSISLQLKKNFHRSTAIVAGMSSLLVVIFVTDLLRLWLVWGSLPSLRTTGVCLLHPT